MSTVAKRSPGKADKPIEHRLPELTEFFSTTLNLGTIDVDVDLIETGVLDSLLLVELIMHLENRYGIVVDIDDLEFENFRSVRNVCAYVEKNRVDKQ